MHRIHRALLYRSRHNTLVWIALRAAAPVGKHPLFPHFRPGIPIYLDHAGVVRGTNLAPNPTMSVAMVENGSFGRAYVAQSYSAWEPFRIIPNEPYPLDEGHNSILLPKFQKDTRAIWLVLFDN